MIMFRFRFTKLTYLIILTYRTFISKSFNWHKLTFSTLYLRMYNITTVFSIHQLFLSLFTYAFILILFLSLFVLCYGWWWWLLFLCSIYILFVLYILFTLFSLFLLFFLFICFHLTYNIDDLILQWLPYLQKWMIMLTLRITSST